MTGMLAAVGAVLLGYGLLLSDGQLYHQPSAYHWASLGLVLASTGLAAAASLGRWRGQADAKADRWLPRVLGFLVAANLVWLLEKSPTRPPDLAAGFSRPLYRAAILLVAVVVASYGWRRLCPSRLRFPLLVVLYLGIGVWVVRSVPSPWIDVWVYEQRAADLLLRGENPYAADYPDFYGDVKHYGPELLRGNQVVGHTYPPLSVLLTVPGRLILGDVRYGLLAAVAATAVLLVATARRLGVAVGHPLELAAVALMFSSRAFFLVAQAWSEPFLALAAAAVLYGLVMGREIALGLALGALISVKQYGVVVLPALWATGRLRHRALGTALLASAVVTAPFLLWDPVALWNGVMAYQTKLSFRPDALSVPAAIFALTGREPPRGLGFIAAAAVVGATLWRAWRARQSLSIARACAASAATLLALFAFDKGFFNYYWFVGVLLLFAAVAGGAAGFAGEAASFSPGGHDREPS